MLFFICELQKAKSPTQSQALLLSGRRVIRAQPERDHEEIVWSEAIPDLNISEITV